MRISDYQRRRILHLIKHFKSVHKQQAFGVSRSSNSRAMRAPAQTARAADHPDLHRAASEPQSGMPQWGSPHAHAPVRLCAHTCPCTALALSIIAASEILLPSGCIKDLIHCALMGLVFSMHTAELITDALVSHTLCSAGHLAAWLHRLDEQVLVTMMHDARCEVDLNLCRSLDC